ncbi:MAG: heme-binding protein [Chloroflexi bacterium]|nr:heme-binding protein [Chloroflexota bacterium]
MPITLAEAERLLQAAQAKAAQMGVKVSIAVADENGRLVALHRMDGAGWYTVEIATAMAFTVAAFRRPGADLINLQERPFFRAFAAMHGGRVLAALGSLPIKRGDQALGGVGASGGSAEQDLEIVQAGVAAL